MITTRSFLTALAPAALFAAAPAFAADTNALTPEQAAEVRDLVREVLADSQQRSTLADGATAGIDNKGKVFIKSEDGKYLMNIYGKVQVRYTYNNAANDSTANTASWSQSNGNGGFEIRRVNLDLSGKLGDGVGYMLELENRIGAANNNATTSVANDNATFGIQKAYGTVDLAEGLSVQAGKFYLPFTREVLISSGAQVAAERSEVNNYFNLGTAEGAQINWTDESDFKTMAAISNGGNSGGVAWNNSPAQYAVCARGEWLVLGSFADTNDNFALVDADKQDLLIGVSGFYQEFSKNNGSTFAAAGAQNPTTVVNPNGSVTTRPAAEAYGLNVDATYKVANLSFYGAGNIVAAKPVPGAAGSSNQYPTPFGLEGQVDWRFLPNVDAFVQYNYISSDVTHRFANTMKDLHEVTVGANYHINSKTKLTGDVTWIVSGDKPVTVGAISSGAVGAGAGFVNNATTTHNRLDGQVAARLQLQVSF